MKGIGSFWLSVTLLVVSCGQAQTAKTVPADTTATPAPPPPPALTGPEISRYTSMTDKFFQPLLNGHFNGSILVAKNGVVLYEKYKGFRNPVRKQDSLNEHTAFHLASISKTFTAMATLKLWQEGKLDIHDPVSKYLTGFPYPTVTIQTLLNHRSGLHNYVHFMYKPFVDKHQFLHNSDVLQYIVAHSQDKDVFSGFADRHFEYSNTNYALLALIIEKVSGMTLPEYLSKTFFQPLHMEDTYVYTPADSARMMGSWYQNGRPFRMEFLDQVYGDKNVYSTVRDMYKWDQGLRSGQFFTKTILDSAYAGYSFEKPGQRNYGLGWRMLMIPNGKKLIYHNGWWHGNRTVFVRCLDENATIIVLCNNDYKLTYASKRLADLFGDYRQGNTSYDEGESDPSASGAGAAEDAMPKVAPVMAPPPAHHAVAHHVVKKTVHRKTQAVASKKKTTKKKEAK